MLRNLRFAGSTCSHMPSILASDYLWDVKKHEIPSFCVVYGDDEFLKYHAIRAIRDHVLTQDDAEFSLSRFEGKNVKLETVLSELAMQSMFGGRRLIWIEDADPFITKHRPALEEYAEKPNPKSVLLLEPSAFLATTRLFKKLADTGFLVNAVKPKEKELAKWEKTLPKWVARWAKQRHKTAFDADAASLLVDFVGPELGLLDQEIAKLALLVPPNGSVSSAIVAANVGSWRTRKVFDIANAAFAGKSAEAIRQLDNLLLAGVKPQGILPQIAFLFRQFGAATQVILDAEKKGRKIPVSVALESVGINKYFLEQSEKQLKMLGRRRGAKILQWLLQAELDMKGESRMNPRTILETLLIRVSDPKFK